jgi:hypothetical protein
MMQKLAFGPAVTPSDRRSSVCQWICFLFAGELGDGDVTAAGGLESAQGRQGGCFWMGCSSFLMAVAMIALSYSDWICLGRWLMGRASSCKGLGSGIMSHDQGGRSAPVVPAARAAGAAPGGPRRGIRGSPGGTAGRCFPGGQSGWGGRGGRDMPTSWAEVLASPLRESSPAWPRDGRPLSAAVGGCRRRWTTTGGAAPSRDRQNLRGVVGGCGLAR